MEERCARVAAGYQNIERIPPNRTANANEVVGEGGWCSGLGMVGCLGLWLGVWSTWGVLSGLWRGGCGWAYAGVAGVDGVWSWVRLLGWALVGVGGGVWWLGGEPLLRR